MVWGVSFLLTNRKSYGHAQTLDEAKAAFRVEYERWQGEAISETMRVSCLRSSNRE